MFSLKFTPVFALLAGVGVAVAANAVNIRCEKSGAKRTLR
jgi:hypothetical protein